MAIAPSQPTRSAPSGLSAPNRATRAATASASAPGQRQTESPQQRSSAGKAIEFSSCGRSVVLVRRTVAISRRLRKHFATSSREPQLRPAAIPHCAADGIEQPWIGQSGDCGRQPRIFIVYAHLLRHSTKSRTAHRGRMLLKTQKPRPQTSVFHQRMRQANDPFGKIQCATSGLLRTCTISNCGAGGPGVALRMVWQAGCRSTGPPQDCRAA